MVESRKDRMNRLIKIHAADLENRLPDDVAFVLIFALCDGGVNTASMESNLMPVSGAPLLRSIATRFEGAASHPARAVPLWERNASAIMQKWRERADELRDSGVEGAQLAASALDIACSELAEWLRWSAANKEKRLWIPVRETPPPNGASVLGRVGPEQEAPGIYTYDAESCFWEGQHGSESCPPAPSPNEWLLVRDIG